MCIYPFDIVIYFYYNNFIVRNMLNEVLTNNFFSVCTYTCDECRAVKTCVLGRYRVNPLSTQPNRVPTQPEIIGFLSCPNQRVRVGFVCVIVYPKKKSTLC